MYQKSDKEGSDNLYKEKSNVVISEKGIKKENSKAFFEILNRRY